jgi:Zn-dependent peptidase ImmA (M78 family)
LKITWIDKIIVGILDTYHTRNPYELCDLLKITIQKVNEDSQLLQGQPSLYFRNFPGIKKEIIFVNNNLYESYEKFFIEHELGHAILHPNIENSLNNNLWNFGKMERQANYFAFKLRNLKVDTIEFNQLTVDQIASCLEVPEQAFKQLANI